MHRFFFEIEIKKYGIESRSYNSYIYFFVDIEADLRDYSDMSYIWSQRIKEKMKISPTAFNINNDLGNIITGKVLADLTEEEIVEGLNNLFKEAAELISDRLEKDYKNSF